MRYKNNEGLREAGHIDVDGYLDVHLSQKEFKQWQQGKGWFTAFIPENGRKSFRREEVFSYYELTESWPKSTVTKKAVPEKNPNSMIGKALPSFDQIGLNAIDRQVKDKKLLICFFDYQQRPSRNCILQLSKKTKELEEKGIVVIAVQASKIEQAKPEEWIKENNITIPVGMIEGDSEKTRFTWGVKSLPWLILTNENHIVTAEGFSISELDKKIK